MHICKLHLLNFQFLRIQGVGRTVKHSKENQMFSDDFEI